jgi:hypothetical protein
MRRYAPTVIFPDKLGPLSFCQNIAVDASERISVPLLSRVVIAFDVEKALIFDSSGGATG